MSIPGLATHWQLPTKSYKRSACGTVAPLERMTSETKKVDCVRCRRSMKTAIKKKLEELGVIFNDDGTMDVPMNGELGIEILNSFLLPKSEDFRRASGDVLCTCGKPYRKHPLGGPDGFDGKFLNQLCDGSLVKL